MKGPAVVQIVLLVFLATTGVRADRGPWKLTGHTVDPMTYGCGTSASGTRIVGEGFDRRHKSSLR